MKILYFTALLREIGNGWKSDHEQYDIVFTQTDFIEYHIENSRRFALYTVFKFFVEVEYDLWSNKVVGKRSFVDGELLHRYI